MKIAVIANNMPVMRGYSILSTRKIAPGMCRARVRVGTYVLEVEGTTARFKKLDQLGTNELVAELLDRVPKRMRVQQQAQPQLPVMPAAAPAQQQAAVEVAAAKQLLDQLGITELLQEAAASAPAQQQTAQQDPDWTCACGKQNAGTACFCAACGKAKPQPAPQPAGWTCACGAENAHDANFCVKCGKEKPKPAPTMQQLFDEIGQLRDMLGKGNGKPGNGSK